MSDMRLTRKRLRDSLRQVLTEMNDYDYFGSQGRHGYVENALRAAVNMLAELNSRLQSHELYDQDHPDDEEIIRILDEAIGEIEEAMRLME